ncbi:MAG TPA: hypothetical protein VM491_19495 [Burkholderiaceae bacterium]|jgi:hypothetical protein|nr:hypothetical protein [Burkholderiaceae bacterium]
MKAAAIILMGCSASLLLLQLSHDPETVLPLLAVASAGSALLWLLWRRR